MGHSDCTLSIGQNVTINNGVCASCQIEPTDQMQPAGMTNTCFMSECD